MKTHPDTLIIHLSAVLHPLLELLRRLICLVKVFRDLALHPSTLRVNCRINHSILDRLGDNVLCVLLRVEVELDADIGKGNAGVSKSDGAQSSLDDKVSQTRDEEVGRVGEKGSFMGLESFLETGNVTDTYGLNDLEVRGKSLFEDWLAEQGSVGNDTSQQHDDDKVLVDKLDKSGGNFAFGCSPDRCLKIIAGFSIVELNGSKSPSVE